MHKYSTIINANKEGIDIKCYNEDFHISFNELNKSMQQYLVFSMLSKIKEIFFKMPVEKFSIEYIITDKSSSIINFYKQVFDIINCILINTNEKIKEYKEYKGFAKEFSNTVFYVFEEDDRIDGFYKKNMKSNKNIIFQTYKSGFNKMKRIWEEEEKITLDNLVKLILKNKAHKIVLQNYYVFTDFIAAPRWIYLPAIFKYFEIEAHSIDVDTAEYINGIGPILRDLFHNRFSTRYTYNPYLSSYWDEVKGLKNIYYTPVIQHYNKNKINFNIDDNYNILVLSNSRLVDVKCDLNEILFVLEKFNSENIFHELQIWYLTMRWFLYNRIWVDEYTKINISFSLMRIMYHSSQFLKFYTIEKIESDRKIEIYGDKGWEKIFPDYYQNKFLNKNELLDIRKRKDYLHLLINNNFTYLDGGGPIYDILTEDIPFLTFSSLVKNKELNGLKYIEYTNKDDLNYKLNNFCKFNNNTELINSLNFIKDVFVNGEEDVVKRLSNKIDDNGITLFKKMYTEQREMIENSIEEYFVENEDIIKKSYQTLFVNQNIDFDIKKSKFYKYDFLQRIKYFI
jgi:hypothetical protein